MFEAFHVMAAAGTANVRLDPWAKERTRMAADRLHGYSPDVPS